MANFEWNTFLDDDDLTRSCKTSASPGNLHASLNLTAWPLPLYEIRKFEGFFESPSSQLCTIQGLDRQILKTLQRFQSCKWREVKEEHVFFTPFLSFIHLEVFLYSFSLVPFSNKESISRGKIHLLRHQTVPGLLAALASHRRLSDLNRLVTSAVRRGPRWRRLRTAWTRGAELTVSGTSFIWLEARFCLDGRCF